MIVGADTTSEAIRRVFLSEARQGLGPLDVHTLYSLWRKTGLRRDDLSAGIVALHEAGELRAQVRRDTCLLTLTRRKRRRSATRDPAAEQQRGYTLRYAAARAPSMAAGFPGQYRRARDRTAPRTGERRERRYGRLLGALPVTEREYMMSLLELVPLRAGTPLWTRGEPIRLVYFPIDCVLSCTLGLADGFSAGLALIGNDGMAGISPCLGEERAPFGVSVIRGGYAHCLPAAQMVQEFCRQPALRRLLLRHTRALIEQLAFTAICNRHHPVEAQLCRLLLSIADRIRSSTLPLTHESIAAVLGVRREGVTQALGTLARAGMVRAERGRVTLLDRGALEGAACECYAARRTELEWLRPEGVAQLLSPETEPAS